MSCGRLVVDCDEVGGTLVARRWCVGVGRLSRVGSAGYQHCTVLRYHRTTEYNRVHTTY